MTRSPSFIVFFLAALLLLALALQSTIGGYAGILTCMLGSALMAWQVVRKRQRLERWSADLDATPPADLAGYDNVIAHIYRQHRLLRRQAGQDRAMREDWQNMLQAMPLGVLRLDESLHLTWCNAMGEQLLELSMPEDLGVRITNFLRMPVFVTYTQDRKYWSQGLALTLRTGAVTVKLVQDSPASILLLVRPAMLIPTEPAFAPAAAPAAATPATPAPPVTPASPALASAQAETRAGE